MKPAIMPTESIEDRYNRVKSLLRCATIERAQRIVENWNIALAPDDRDRELAWQIFYLTIEFREVERLYLSERGELMFLGCQAGEHRKCTRTINGRRCNCECHASREGEK